ncbi:MAG TPA: NUDIX hydrolase [Pyrinomonadaceae bacterium]|jgi:8-oxo-dGTP pyrophosphatase MutT (NUDIX family)
MKSELTPPDLWRRKRSEQVADCRVFQVRRDWSTNPRDASEHPFYVLEAPDWVNIIPVTKDEQVVLIEQYRHGTEELTLEAPGGMVDEGESAHEAAARELLEETGYASDELILLGRTRPNPAIQNNWIYSFLARGAEFRQTPAFDSTEHVAVRLVPLESIPRLVARGEITHSLVVVSFHWLSLYEDGLIATSREASIT